MPNNRIAAPVKSAKRVLEVFELFDKIRRPASVTDVVNYLGYPASSTAVLLRSLVDLGYMKQDARDRRYTPTPRIALLGEWVGMATWGEGDVSDLMERVHAATGQVTILAGRLGLDAQYMAIIEPDSGDMTYMPGARRPLFHTAAGIAVVASYVDAVIGQLVRHFNAVHPPEKRVGLPSIMRGVEETRRRGYAKVLDKVRVGRGSVAMLLPLDPLQDRPIALSVSADTEVLRRQETDFIVAMREGIDVWRGVGKVSRSKRTASARPGDRPSSSLSGAGKVR